MPATALPARLAPPRVGFEPQSSAVVEVGAGLAEWSLAELFGRVQHGEDAAFHELYLRTRLRLTGVVYGVLRSADLTYDVVQDAYAHIWVHRHQFQPDQGSVLGWMTTIARRRAIDRVRATHSARHLETRYAATAGTEDDQQTRVVDRLYASALTGPALLALTPRQHEALRLTYWEGCTAAEAAALLGIPLPTLKSRLHSAVTRLRGLLDPPTGPTLA